MNKKIIIGAITISLVAIFIGTIKVQAATISVGDASGYPNETVSIPVNLTSGGTEKVAGLNFDLKLDSSQITFNNATAGSATLDASKELAYSEISPGILRIIIYGVNENIVANGKLADISFVIKGTASPGTVNLTLTNAVAVDFDAKEIPLTLENGRLTILTTGAGIKGDIDGNGKVNSLDYALLISKWFQTTNIEKEDLNKDGKVDVRDLGIMMSNWTG